jgi:hypothetical protein
MHFLQQKLRTFLKGTNLQLPEEYRERKALIAGFKGIRDNNLLPDNRPLMAAFLPRLRLDGGRLKIYHQTGMKLHIIHPFSSRTRGKIIGFITQPNTWHLALHIWSTKPPPMTAGMFMPGPDAFLLYDTLGIHFWQPKVNHGLVSQGWLDMPPPRVDWLDFCHKVGTFPYYK